MHHKITTLIFDMYGVILKERTGNFIPYTLEHFDEAEHERIKDLIEIKNCSLKPDWEN